MTGNPIVRFRSGSERGVQFVCDWAVCGWIVGLCVIGEIIVKGSENPCCAPALGAKCVSIVCSLELAVCDCIVRD